VPEVLSCARAMKAGMAHIEPILSDAGVEPIGKVVMGTVKGDLHDIGKNLCIMMLRGAGFTVIDLGVDVSPDDFIEAIEEHQPPLMGMSALLTTQAVPSFVRGMVKRIYTDYAQENGIAEITPAIMDRARTELGLEGM
jgi:5-methyltetrahydrofolate--homocysteine methyltransferase